MNADARYWQDLQSLFHLLRDVPPQERERVLADECTNPGLRARVRALLQASDEETRACAPKPAEEEKFRRIGPYFVIQCLGSGGAGTVYLVEREVVGIRQKAALKMLYPAAVEVSFVDRFQREQRILASLDHPNIVRMLDAGFDEEGRPYLVMEYVAGRQLDRLCDERKLTIEDRLRLFLKVCDAVAYAHRSLVVHLDLKPSNILVTAEGAPKLLDFGTSKLFEAGGQLTTTVPLTPAYASPEQLRNEPVTTACDVYSLGVILYELLAGRRPAGESSLAVLIESAVQEREPAPLTHALTPEAAQNRGVSENRLRSLLAGDLSTMVRKCLSPRPRERYASVSILCEDIERYLDGRPVLAQKQSAVYHLKKFLRRNKSKALTLSLLLFAVAGSLVYALVQQQRAIQEGARAARTQAFMSQLFRLANSNAPASRFQPSRIFLPPAPNSRRCWSPTNTSWPKWSARSPTLCAIAGTPPLPRRSMKERWPTRALSEMPRQRPKLLPASRPNTWMMGSRRKPSPSLARR